MEDTPKGTTRLDINAEKEVAEEYLDRLRVQGATNEEITSTMKDLGIKRFLRILQNMLKILKKISNDIIVVTFMSIICIYTKNVCEIINEMTSVYN